MTNEHSTTDSVDSPVELSDPLSGDPFRLLASNQPHFDVLLFLLRHSYRPLKPSRISERIGYDEDAVVTACEKLVEAELVRKHTEQVTLNDVDGRTQFVPLDEADNGTPAFPEELFTEPTEPTYAIDRRQDTCQHLMKFDTALTDHTLEMQDIFM